MAIKIKNKKDKSVLKIEGELTIYKALEYKEYLVKKFNVDKPLDVDLEGVEEIDSCGVQLLAAMSKQLENNGREMHAIATSVVAKEALETNRLLKDMVFIVEGVQHES